MSYVVQDHLTPKGHFWERQPGRLGARGYAGHAGTVADVPQREIGSLWGTISRTIGA